MSARYKVPNKQLLKRVVELEGMVAALGEHILLQQRFLEEDPKWHKHMEGLRKAQARADEKRKKGVEDGKSK